VIRCFLKPTAIVALLSTLIVSLSPIAYGQVASTPAGIMLVEVHREEGFSSDQYFWTRLGSANGNTLFYFTGSGNSISDKFNPVLAEAGAVPFDDWSLIPLQNSSNQSAQQWAYQSRPLFTWTEEQEAGAIAINVALYGAGPNGEAPLSKNRRDASIPPEGWQVARFTPSESAQLPDGIDLRLIDSGQGTVFTNFEGYSLYGFDSNNTNPEDACTSKQCLSHWTPISAPALAFGLGDFSIIERADGSRQWAFQEAPLFRYKEDLLPGDVHGSNVHPSMQLALLQKNFRPNSVAVISQPGYGDVFTLNGRTLYFGSAFEKYWGGRNLRGSFEIAYHKGKRLGDKACVSDTCLENWRPFTAPADASSNGFWEVIARDDGSKQWAYKGFALYTHSNDQSPGHMRGHSLYDIADVDGDSEALARTRLLAEVGNAMGGAGIYWSIAKP
jgi:predicted lipoprotein with Yx(FWY)xxD motif